MCDYSLEQFQSRPARTGEQYVTDLFSTGSVGIVSPDDPQTAVCVPYDAGLRLENIPKDLQVSCGLDARADAVFAQQPHGRYRDGVAFANGARLSLQELGPDVTVSVTHLLDDGVPAEPAAEPVTA